MLLPVDILYQGLRTYGNLLFQNIVSSVMTPLRKTWLSPRNPSPSSTATSQVVSSPIYILTFVVTVSYFAYITNVF